MSPPETRPRAGLPPRYKVLETIGSGGMGAVFRVQDHVRGEVVALKLLRDHENEQQLARFLREIETMRTLEHPGIVPFLDAGTLRSGRPFYTMPYYEGSRTLARWIEHRREAGRLPPAPAEILAFLWPLASALDHVHALGFCHRDIKPGNILVTSGESALLLDFGLIGILGSQSTRLTSTGDVLGTLTYLSPEHARGRGTGPASDIFQMGLVLHEMITGVRVIEEPLDFVRKVICDDDPLPAAKRRHPLFSPALERVLLRCLATSPEERPATAGELQAELERLPLDGWYSREDAPSVVTDPGTRHPEPAPSRALEALDLEDSFLEHLSEDFRRRYALDRVLGRGGVGVVFAGRDHQLDREVAVKFMRRLSRGGTDEGARRFAQEAKLLARITHPNLVKVYDLHIEGDLAYFVSEYVEGEPLDRLLDREKPLPLDRVRRLALDVTAGLEALHQEGILHRDIKPSNLMVTSAGIKILDLGIAQILSDATMGLTRTGQVIGTPLYCSPEQLEASKIDATTDLYSLGLVMYEALSGKRPFPGSLYEVVARKARGEMEPLEGPIPIPQHVKDLVTSLLSSDPSARPPSAAALREKLERRWSDRPTDRTPVGARPRGRTGSSPLPSPTGAKPARRPVAAGVAVLAALLATLLLTRSATVSFSGLSADVTLSGLAVRFEREPPGPASLRVRWPDGRERTLSSAAASRQHRVLVEGLSAGDSVELAPVADGLAGAPLTMQYQPVTRTGLELEHRPDLLVVTFVTSTPVTVRLRARRPSGDVLLCEEKQPATRHVLDVEARHMPFVPPLQLELSQEGDSLDERLELDPVAQGRLLTFQAEWFQKTLDQFLQRFDRYNRDSGKTDGVLMIGEEMERYRRGLVDLDSDLPEKWLLETLGGKHGILDHPQVIPTLKDRFHRSLYLLEVWDTVRHLLAITRHYPHEMLYGEHFGPSTKTRYPSAHELPILLEGRSPTAVLHLAADAPFTAHREAVASLKDATFSCEGRLQLGKLAPGSRAELTVTARIPEGRQIHVLVNDTFQVRLHPIERQTQAVTATWYAGFDPRYLREGENRFVFSVPSLPIILENLSADKLIRLDPPGFALRLLEE